ncbi:MAG: hypothetical protein ACLP9D_06155 [Candidatus Bathyarchaeia archaeon]
MIQIVQVNEKDYIDTFMLIREHAIGKNGNTPETIETLGIWLNCLPQTGAFTTP